MASAQNAARAIEGADIRTVDSRSITAGLGSQVKAAARAAVGGASADEVEATIERTGSLVQAIDGLDGQARRLAPIEIDETERIFSNPSVQATEDYISGRFG